MSKSATVKFKRESRGEREPDGTLVVWRVVLDEEEEYACFDHNLANEHDIQVDGEVRIRTQDGIDRVAEDETLRNVEMVAGRLIIIADPLVELPSWDQARRDMRS